MELDRISGSGKVTLSRSVKNEEISYDYQWKKGKQYIRLTSSLKIQGLYGFNDHIINW